jgi:hypothetical protein
MGYGRGRGKKIVGIRTDFRGSEDHGLNRMLSNACSDVVLEPSTATTLGQLAERIVALVWVGETLERQEEP